MGNIRRSYEAQFAMVDIGFIVNDPRLDGLTGRQRWIYLVLWCLAVKERMETLPAAYYPPNPDRPGSYRPATLARLTREDPRTIAAAMTKLRQNRLIVVADDGAITVSGVRGKHPNLKWKDGDKTRSGRPYLSPQTEAETEKELEEQIESKLDIKLEQQLETKLEQQTEHKTTPPVSPDDAEITKKKVIENLEHRTLTAAFIKCYEETPSPATIQAILTRCRRLDWNPLDLVEAVEFPFAVLADMEHGRYTPGQWAKDIGSWQQFRERVFARGARAGAASPARGGCAKPA